MSDDTDIQLQFLRRDRSALEALLRTAGAVFKGKATKCPFHEDATASAGVYEKDGIWRFKCHGCGVCEDFVGITALIERKKSGDVLKAMHPKKETPKEKPAKAYASVDELCDSIPNVEARYIYSHPETKAAEMIVLRRRDADGRKTFIQASSRGDGFVMSAPPKPWPIYNRGRIASATSVIVCEGEKCVHALHDLGIVATTSPGGAGKAPLADWTPLAGRIVYLWPDNDPADKEGIRKGDAHMRDVLRELEKLAPPVDVRWIEPTVFDLPDKGDVVEYLEMWGGETHERRRESIECAMNTAQAMGGSEPLRKRLEDAKSGRLKSVAWPYRAVTSLSKALLPGTVTCICADAGSGKSFLGLECLIYWVGAGVKASAHMLEDGKDYHLNRILAQLEENGDYADIDWLNRKENAKLIDEAYSRHRIQLDALAPLIDATDEPTNYDALVEWMERRSKDGCRVLLIDPITAVPVNEKPWLEDQRFIMRAKSIVRRYGNSLVLMTHPRSSKSKTKGSLSDLAGGAAFPRFSHTVFWLERHDEPKTVYVKGPVGDFRTNINRTLRMSKTRNGCGAGAAIGFNFSHGLRFAEQGLIQKERASETIEPPVVTADPFGD